MSNLLITILLSTALLCVAFALLGLGYIVKGKSIVRPGGCGIDPTKKRDGDCGNQRACALCENEKEEPDDDLPEG